MSAAATLGAASMGATLGLLGTLLGDSVRLGVATILGAVAIVMGLSERSRVQSPHEDA